MGAGHSAKLRSYSINSPRVGIGLPDMSDMIFQIHPIDGLEKKRSTALRCHVSYLSACTTVIELLDENVGKYLEASKAALDLRRSEIRLLNMKSQTSRTSVTDQTYVCISWDPSWGDKLIADSTELSELTEPGQQPIVLCLIRRRMGFVYTASNVDGCLAAFWGCKGEWFSDLDMGWQCRGNAAAMPDAFRVYMIL